MIYKASKLITKSFDQEGIKYGGKILESDECSVVRAGFQIDNASFVEMKFFSYDDDNDVSARAYRILNITDESKLPAIMQVISECNNEYRFFKFVCDQDHDVNMEYDFPQKLSDDSVGPVAVEIFIRFMSIVNEIYPKFMKALWC